MSDLDKNQTVATAEETTSQEQQEQNEISVEPAILEEMVKAGLLYGRKKSKTHPKMKPFIVTTRNGIEIFDLPRTFSTINKAEELLRETAKKGGLVLIVGTHPAAKDLVKEAATRLNVPYVSERWLGGTLTNFKTLSKRTQYYMNLKADRESGKLEKYTKKERLQFDKEIEKMSVLFSGLEKLNRLPDVLLVVDANENEIAIREAQKLGIPVIALANSDINPETLDYPIPANTQSKSSIKWVLDRLAASIEEGLKEKQTIQATTAVKEEAKQ